jgi:hypothetical protein
LARLRAVKPVAFVAELLDPAGNNGYMDVSSLKGRIAEALVESIFRRAGYQVARVGRESQVHGLLKVGASEFAPDFLVWKQAQGDESAQPLHRLLPIEVKYRSNLREFVRKEASSLIAKVRDQWPQLYCIVITDHPDNGRSCFQVFEVKTHIPDVAPVLVDLHELTDLDIFRTTVQEYEGLVREIFTLLNVYARATISAPKE